MARTQSGKTNGKDESGLNARNLTSEMTETLEKAVASRWKRDTSLGRGTISTTLHEVGSYGEGSQNEGKEAGLKKF